MGVKQGSEGMKVEKMSKKPRKLAIDSQSIEANVALAILVGLSGFLENYILCFCLLA
jgi:hypothetical protein